MVTACTCKHCGSLEDLPGRLCCFHRKFANRVTGSYTIDENKYLFINLPLGPDCITKHLDVECLINAEVHRSHQLVMWDVIGSRTVLTNK